MTTLLTQPIPSGNQSDGQLPTKTEFFKQLTDDDFPFTTYVTLIRDNERWGNISVTTDEFRVTKYRGSDEFKRLKAVIETLIDYDVTVALKYDSKKSGTFEICFEEAILSHWEGGSGIYEVGSISYVNELSKTKQAKAKKDYEKAKALLLDSYEASTVVNLKAAIQANKENQGTAG